MRILQDDARFHAELEPDWMTDTSGIPQQDYESFLASEGNLAFVAEANGEVVGVIFLHEGAGIDPGQKYLRIYWVGEIAVGAEWRDSGIGQTLMTHAESVLKQRGVRAICLDVWTTNSRARHIYDKLGYSTFRNRMFKPL